VAFRGRAVLSAGICEVKERMQRVPPTLTQQSRGRGDRQQLLCERLQWVLSGVPWWARVSCVGARACTLSRCGADWVVSGSPTREWSDDLHVEKLAS
jgi:hypothetical protein